MTDSGSPPDQRQWDAVCRNLRQRLGAPVFDEWLARLDFVRIEKSRVYLAAPTRFLAKWIAAHYADKLRRAWTAENPEIARVILLPPAAAGRPGAGVRSGAAPAPRPASNPAALIPPAPFETPIDERFTFESFITAPSNYLAWTAAQRIARPETPAANPLFIHGAVGLGKTHLMHAAAGLARRAGAQRVVALSAERFRYHFIKALRQNDTLAFKSHFRAIDLFLIDDIQFITGRATQEEFFHLFNMMRESQTRIAVFANRAPSGLEGIEERIRSRLGWGLVADIAPTDYDLRRRILRAKLARLAARAPIARPVLDFLARRITSNIRELEGALHRLAAHAELAPDPVSVEKAEIILKDLISANQRRLSIDDIQRSTARYYQISLADMVSRRRARAIARPRHVAMYLAKILTARSLPEIGRQFGGRDHSTVVHALRRIEQLRRTNPEIDAAIETLRRRLEN